MFQRPSSPRVPPLLTLNWVRPALVGLVVVVALLLSGHSLAAMEQTGQASASRNDVSATTVAFLLEWNDHHCQHDEGRVSSAWGLAHGKRQDPQGDSGPAIGFAAPCARLITAAAGKPSRPARSAPLPLFLLTQRLRP
ncbi:hypothetical protein CR157_10780 [Halomonas sp. LBP4]|nr:hypothetical protein CR157_10780 [Halomonas sp. LBP4]